MAEVKIDKANMCIDRSTNLGKQFDALNKKIAESEDETEKAFMSQISAYAEAAMVIENMCSPEEAKDKLAQLVAQMDATADAMKTN